MGVKTSGIMKTINNTYMSCIYTYYCKWCHQTWHNHDIEDSPLYDIDHVTSDGVYVGWCPDCNDHDFSINESNENYHRGLLI